jgi:hypothetical protein
VFVHDSDDVGTVPPHPQHDIPHYLIDKDRSGVISPASASEEHERKLMEPSGPTGILLCDRQVRRGVSAWGPSKAAADDLTIGETRGQFIREL